MQQQNRTTLIIGIALVAFGGIAIFNILFNINIWAVFWPLLLIGIGLLVIFRPKTIDSNTELIFRPLGDLNFAHEWQVSPKEIWFFVGDVDFDFSQALIPEGVTKIRLFSFVGDIRVRENANAGLKIRSSAFITDSKINGQKENYFLSPMNYTSLDYETYTQKVDIESWFFVGEIRVES